MDFSFASTIKELQKTFHLPKSVFENLETLTYGEFIDKINNNKEA